METQFDGQRHAARTRARRVTLFEVLIVVAILALISGSVGAAAMTYFDRTRKRTAESNAREIRAAVKGWWIDHDRENVPASTTWSRQGASIAIAHVAIRGAKRGASSARMTTRRSFPQGGTESSARRTISGSRRRRAPFAAARS